MNKKLKNPKYYRARIILEPLEVNCLGFGWKDAKERIKKECNNKDSLTNGLYSRIKSITIVREAKK